MIALAWTLLVIAVVAAGIGSALLTLAWQSRSYDRDWHQRQRAVQRHRAEHQIDDVMQATVTRMLETARDAMMRGGGR